MLKRTGGARGFNRISYCRYRCNQKLKNRSSNYTHKMSACPNKTCVEHMIIRHYIKCSTCNAPHTLRISVGRSEWQEHGFHCSQCEEIIRVGMEVDFKKIETHIKCIENCTDGHLEGTIVNLSPDLPVNTALIHEDDVSPFLTNPNVWSLANSNVKKTPGKIAALAKRLPNFRDASDEWKLLKKAWSLYNNRKMDLLVEVLKVKFKTKRDVKPSDFLNWLFDFCKYFAGRSGMEKFKNVTNFIDGTSRRNFPLYGEFLIYFYDNIGDNNFSKYLDLFLEYFANYSEFNQVSFYSLLGVEVPTDFIVTSVRFNKTKMFYGNAYELFTSKVVLLALLNNVAKGRRFDQFSEMDLRKYLTIDKANRCSPFQDIPELHAICSPLDSTLRNASHHGAINFNRRTHMISYNSGGTGAEHKMTYTRYLEKCVDIMISICVLLMMETAYLYSKE